LAEIEIEPILPAVLERATALHRSGDLAEAERLYKTILAAKPDHLSALHLLGLVALQRGHHDEGLRLIDNALAIKPDYAEALNNRGSALGALNRQPEALESYDKALAIKPDYAGALNNRGNALGALNRLEEALESYDKALAIKPDYPDALNNRGNALGALNRQPEAVESYDKALAIKPDDAEALYNRGIALGALNRLREALESYDRALAIRPDHAQALYNRGIALAALNRRQEALQSYDKALALKPNDADALNNRGITLAALGRQPEALESYDKALALKPNDVDALNNRGTALAALNRQREALDSYDKALALKPDDAEALNNRGIALAALNRGQEALESYDKALALKPNDPDALSNRGIALGALNRHPEALESYDKVLAIKPDHAQALYNRGIALAALNRRPEALESYDKALALKPDYAEALYNRGFVLAELNRGQEAVESYDKALAISPEYYAEVRFARCMAQLPVVYMSELEITRQRAAYEDCLRVLCDDVDRHPTRADLAKGIGSSQPFYLPYQGYNDRDLQCRYGAMVCRIMAERYPPVALGDPPRQDEPIRLGIVSGYFRDHSNWKIPIKGWVSQLDRRQFRIFAYHTGTERDAETGIAAGSCEHFVQGPMTVDRWRQTILADAPHVLLYPEVGIDPVSVQLAAQRLAPVQCTSWGHPETSGFPTLDYYLSSDLMEPPDGQDHYSERLVRLPNLSIYYEPIGSRSAPVARADLGLRPAATAYWCGQSLFKYLPQFDQVFPRIAQQVGDCQFAFIEYQKGSAVTDQFRERLARAFAAHGLRAADHCVFLPRLDHPRFVAAIGCCDIVLDSIGWSGANSTLESLSSDLPIVTMTAPFMRGRHSMAILEMMGVTDTIAPTVDDYVSTAVRLARDDAWRAAVKRNIAANKNRVYRDRSCISALAAFFDRVTRRGASTQI